MSSTLFGRGINTQVGLSRRAEEVAKNISDLKTSIGSVKDLPNEVRLLRSQVSSLESRLAERETAQKVLEARFAQLDDALSTLKTQVESSSKKGGKAATSD